MTRHPKAFTLIELLIVVAIIAILAAIAVPNFLEAQTRSKISRTKADMRTTATALEAYYVDYNAYVPCNTRGTAVRLAPFESSPESGFLILERLSTPIAYLSTSLLRDPFILKWRKAASTAAGMATFQATPVVPNIDAAGYYNSYIYQSVNPSGRAQFVTDQFTADKYKAHGWFLHSCGPDSTYYNIGGVLDVDYNKESGTISMIYDATNGTVSEGSIWRNGGNNRGGPDYAAGQGLAEAIQTQK